MCNLPPEVRAALYGVLEDDVPADETADLVSQELEEAWETV